jgi:alkylation response protein AidB-like acyl-CoA dehydrogenase
MAHLADYALLLANTSREETKHHNLSFFIVDMRQPGVDVRPLIQMTGTAEFNEVFLTDVEVNDANRLGNVNDGWRVARLTLSSERLTQGVGFAYEVGPVLERAIDRYRISTERDDNLTSHLRRGQLVELWVRDRVLRHLQLWTLAGSHQLRDCAPAALKILKSELFKDVTNFSVSAAGPEGMLYPGGYRFERSKSIMEFENDQQFFLRCRARSIGGGTSEVLRNMVAERVLSLPR